MMNLDERLRMLQRRVMSGERVRVMIMGLGSVGLYLLDYLVSAGDPQMDFVVVGRNAERMQTDVNIVRTAATIRGQYRGVIAIDVCDLNDPDAAAAVIARHKPDFIVNSSRVYSGLKYGSISWSSLRAYGIWTPLSVKYAKNIMEACRKAETTAITINTSYSDAVIPWLKASGMPYFDFGSGNLNHLIPRMKFYVAEKFGVDNLNDIDITLAVSHFHDVVISKEGHAEGQDILMSVKIGGREVEINKADCLRHCSIAMPVDQKRNMMNASSNFAIISAVMQAIREHKRVKVHSPGVFGETGGYPVVIDGTGPMTARLDESEFTLDEMRRANRESIYLDGIESVDERGLSYTDELLAKVEREFGVKLPKRVVLSESDGVASTLHQLINSSTHKLINA